MPFFILTVSQFLRSHDAKSALVLLTKQFFTWQREFLKIRRKNEKYFNLVHAHKPKFGLFKSMTSQVVQRPRPLIICICVVSTQRVNSFTKVGHKTRSKSNKWDHSIGTVVSLVLWNGLTTEQSFNLMKLKCNNHFYHLKVARKFLKQKQTNDWITFYWCKWTRT